MNTISSEFLPQPGARGSTYPPPGAAGSASDRARARWSWLPTHRAAWGILIAFALFGAAVVGTAWLAIQEIGEPGIQGQRAAATMEPTQSPARANLPPAATDALNRNTALAGGADGANGTNGTVTSASAATPAPEVAVEPAEPIVVPSNSAPRKTPTENRKRAIARGNPAVLQTGENEATAKATIVTPEAAQVTADPATGASPAPPVPDRWESMNAALAACSRESFFAGVMCTERVRYQYCEGFWGQVPQCRAATQSAPR